MASNFIRSIIPAENVREMDVRSQRGGPLLWVYSDNQLETEAVHSLNNKYLAFIDSENFLKIGIVDFDPKSKNYARYAIPEDTRGEKFISVAFHPESNIIACLNKEKSFIHIFEIEESENHSSGFKLRIISKTVRLRNVKFFRWNPIKHDFILIVSEINKIKTWEYTRANALNGEDEEPFGISITNAVWSYDGNFILIASQQRVIVINYLLETYFNFEEIRNNTLLLVEDSQLFCFGTKENRTGYCMFELDFVVKQVSDHFIL